MTALWWQPLKPDPRCDMFSLSLSPAQQLQWGYFLSWLLAVLAWRQPLGPSEPRATAAIRPLTSTPRPAHAKQQPGTGYWKNWAARVFFNVRGINTNGENEFSWCRRQNQRLWTCIKSFRWCCHGNNRLVWRGTRVSNVSSSTACTRRHF